jgi:hypothetical protein
MLIALGRWTGVTGETDQIFDRLLQRLALLALFPLLAGAVLPIRCETLNRAQCVAALWTLVLAPIMLAAPYVGLPGRIFISPLEVVSWVRNTLGLFIHRSVRWTPRWQFYAPWFFAAVIGIVMVLFGLKEKTLIKWRSIGIAAGL